MSTITSVPFPKMSLNNIFFEHVPIVHIHFHFYFVFKFSLKQTIFRLETCSVLTVFYGLSSLNVPISILSFISLGRSFFFTWRHHTLRQLSMLPDYLFYKMHFSAILFINLFKIGLRIFFREWFTLQLITKSVKKYGYSGFEFSITVFEKFNFWNQILYMFYTDKITMILKDINCYIHIWLTEVDIQWQRVDYLETEESPDSFSFPIKIV